MKRNRTLVRRTTSSNRQKGNKRPTLRRKTTKKSLLKKKTSKALKIVQKEKNVRKQIAQVRIPRRLSMGISFDDFADHLDDIPLQDGFSSSTISGSDDDDSDDDTDSDSSIEIRLR